MQAVGKNLIVQKIIEEKKESKFILPDAVKKCDYFTVISKGDADVCHYIAEDDIVYAYAFGMQEFELDGEKYWLLNAENVHFIK